ncbi:MAG: hypothetical protein AB8U16_05615 [Rickettsiales endosymbiont of Dermacentor nuttalli]
MATLNEEQLEELQKGKQEIIKLGSSVYVEKPVQNIISLPALMQPKISLILKIIPIALVVLLIIMSGIFYNYKIIQYVPSTAFMYVATGLYPSNGLVVDNVVVKEEQEKYQVSYAIKNTNDVEVYMPLVRVTVADNNKNSILYQKVKVKHKLLVPGEVYTNNTSVSVPSNASYIVVDLGNKWELYLRRISDFMKKMILSLI